MDYVSQCSKLPSFLSSSEHTDSSSSMPDSVYSDTPEENDEKQLLGNNNFQSTDNFVIGRNMKSSSDHRRLPTRKIDRQHPNLAVVVPADLGGSRRSTAYMRLNNRVRIIERNVSVSMRKHPGTANSKQQRLLQFASQKTGVLCAEETSSATATALADFQRRL
ncbi:unnamed protein product [Trichobilharzia regenti]|nr:unnamed protein product [Trichobilharzia regenti]